MTRVQLDSIYELIKQCKDRSERNHELYIMDEPKSLCLGVFDSTTDELLQLRIFKLKKTAAELTNEDLIIREALATEVGKCKLFNAKSSAIGVIA